MVRFASSPSFSAVTASMLKPMLPYYANQAGAPLTETRLAQQQPVVQSDQLIPTFHPTQQEAHPITASKPEFYPSVSPTEGRAPLSGPNRLSSPATPLVETSQATNMFKQIGAFLYRGYAFAINLVGDVIQWFSKWGNIVADKLHGHVAPMDSESV